MIDYNAYQDLFEKTVEEDEQLSRYENDLNNRISYLSNLILSTSTFYKMIHPFRLIRTEEELKRINMIGKKYEELKDTPLPYHFDEEDSDVEHNFYVAATYWKPNRMKEFADYYPVNNGNDKKLLKLKKTY